MAFTDEERAELIAALSETADMVELPLRQIDLLIFAQLECGVHPLDRIG